MRVRPSPEDVARVLSRALEEGRIRPEDTALVLHDLDLVDARLREAREAFGQGALHAAAVKANPLPPLLRRIASLGHWTGLEAASLPELLLALESGCPPERIVFDSPAKTVDEIRFALRSGVHLNMDNFQELDRVESLPGSLPESMNARPSLGIRVNPQTGEGAIAQTSVAGPVSKFGVPLEESRERLKAAFDRVPGLTALHVHVGSQGCPVELMVRGVRAVFKLAGEINAAPGPGRVETLDIGGGLPVPYARDAKRPSPADYARNLVEACPGLFQKYRIVTEFGRFVHAGAGFAASRVEYVKEQASPACCMAVIHLGADMFLRECYRPEDWRHEVLLLDSRGRPKTGPCEPLMVAGPLCFSGDFPVPRDLRLPRPDPGDWLVVRDAGAYTLAMWSRYNTRQLPLVLGYEGDGDAIRFQVLKPRETPEDAAGFWSAARP